MIASLFSVELPHDPIKITLPDGKVIEGKALETTPLDVAKQLSNSLAKQVIVAQVKYSNIKATLDQGLSDPMEEEHKEGEQFKVIDCWRPLEGDCELRLLKF